MARKVCLDSDVLINILRNQNETIKMIQNLDADLFTTSINTFELWYGRKNSEDIFQFFEWLNVLEFNQESSILAGDILRKLELKGQILELKDIFIAAICIDNNIELLTNNKKHFERLKEFGLILTE